MVEVIGDVFENVNWEFVVFFLVRKVDVSVDIGV